MHAKGLLAALGLAAALTASSEGQEAVPGGWSPRFGYQGLGPVAPASVAPAPDDVHPLHPSFGAYPTVVGTPIPALSRPVRMANTLGPLGATIRRTTRTRRGR